MIPERTKRARSDHPHPGKEWRPSAPIPTSGTSVGGGGRLAELAAASRTVDPPPTKPFTTAPHPTIAFCLTASILTGIGVSLIGPFEYRCRSTVEVVGESAETHTDMYRQRFLDFTWAELGAIPSRGGWLTSWSVESGPGPVLSLVLNTRDSARGRSVADRIGHSFVRLATEEADRARASPHEVEQGLASLVKNLQQRLGSISPNKQDSSAVADAQSTLENYKQTLNDWSRLRIRYDQARAGTQDAESVLMELRSSGEPTQAVVPPETLAGEILSDSSLQQDIKELATHLAELRLQLMLIWQSCVTPLEQLMLDAQAWVQVAVEARVPLDVASVSSNESLGDHPFADVEGWSRQYMALVEELGPAWNAVMAPVRDDHESSNGDYLLSVHAQLHELSGRFLFDGGQLLSRTRTALRQADAKDGNDARFQVRYSSWLRAFERVQTGHHRFEFAAGALGLRDNFRLDAALHASAGLRRRSRQRITAMEDRLRVAVLDQAKRDWQRSLDRAEEAVRVAGSDRDHLAAELVALQDRLNDLATRGAVAIRLSLQSEQAESTRADIERLLATRSLAEQRRLEVFGDTSVRVLGGAVVQGPTDWASRIRTGGWAATISLAMLGCTRWVGRRRHDR